RVATGEPLGEPLATGAGHGDAAFSPDGRKVIIAAGFGVQWWDADTGELLVRALESEGILRGVAFAPDGKTYATGSEKGTAQIWDAATNEPAGPPLHHQGPVDRPQYSRDGRTLLTTSLDPTARL